MEETIRIRTDIQSDGYAGDKFVNVNLEQKFDFLEILSLRISQEDIYRKFCSDYGVVVGRVQANGGFGVPNANVSVFIPITDLDAENSILYGLYPYQTLLDKNDDGVRYNLLPKKRQNGCHFPVGSFPNKREFLDNDVLLEIHDKYYKFTTTTNNSGDYMLFGLPLGNHTIHIDVDVSDIGVATRRPYDMINEGNPENMFDTPTKYKHDRDLNQLRQIVKGEISVDVVPFWGDTTMCGVGINRIDYELPVYIQTSTMFIGSVITDEDKNSLNRHCRARKKAGEVCEMRTGQGQIEMIRKTLTDQVEYKMIDGGRVIDDDGTWAYQIPMNLHPMVTDEFGNLVPSEDPRKGLLTQAEVRFRVSMDITGGEGRLRETAQYLVPHNPDDASGVDYEFGDETNDGSFYTMRFNKIYTVRNYISRYQSSRAFNADNRNWLGVKSVDVCSDKENFPYNRVDTDINPLFSIIISLLWIVGLIVFFMNTSLIPLVNFIIMIINWLLVIVNSIINAFTSSYCWFINKWNSAFPITIFGEEYLNWDIPVPDICSSGGVNLSVEYMGCMMLTCDQSSGTGSDCEGNPSQESWAPGCECCGCCGGIGATEHCNEDTQGNNGDCLMNADESHPVFNSSADESVINADLSEYITCVASGLAASFNMFKFDFYNDWVNGTLYHFLYKNKRTASHNSFCNVDTSPDSLSGLFGSESYLYDTLTGPKGTLLELRSTEKSHEFVGLEQGVIKEYNEHMYYVPFISGEKIYATDITCLGSSLRCDDDGFPYFIDRIPSTTYNMPPLYDSTVVVCDPTTNSEYVVVTESGIIGFSDEPGLFMNVDLFGLRVNYCQGRNIKLISELGRNTDELTIVPTSITATVPNPNEVIGMLDGHTTYGESYNPLFSCGLNGLEPEILSSVNPDSAESQDIFDEFVRFSLRGCNYNTAVQDPIFDATFASSMYDGSGSYTPHMEFRGFNQQTYGAGDAEFGYDNSTDSPIIDGLANNNSYYFYFGLIPSKSAIDKLNTRYLTDCSYQVVADFLLRGVITNNIIMSGTSGVIEVTILGGVAPYSYLFTRPDGSEIYVDEENSDVLTFAGLESGIYTIIVTDSTGGSSRGVYEVTEPQPVVAGITIIHPQAAGTATGEIVIVSLINGGPQPTPIYIITISGPINDTITTTTTPVSFVNLPEGDYLITVTSMGVSVEYNVTLLDPPPFTVYVTGNDIMCHNQTGSINFQVSGGTPPVQVTMESGSIVSHAFGNGGLSAGTYDLSAVDILGQIPTTIIVNGSSYDPSVTNPIQFVITNPDLLDIDMITSENVILTRNGITGLINFTVNGGTDNTELKLNGTLEQTAPTPFIYSESKHAGTYDFSAIDTHGCEAVNTVVVLEPSVLTVSLHSMIEPNCYTGDTGSITIQASGGIPYTDNLFNSYKHITAYEVSITNGSIVKTETLIYDSNVLVTPYATFDDLGRDTWTATVRDYYWDGSFHQYAGLAVTTDVVLTSPNQLTLDVVQQTASSITVIGNGGTTSYTYHRWNGSNWVMSTGISNKFTGLISVTSYSFKVTDSHGCVTYESFSTT